MLDFILSLHIYGPAVRKHVWETKAMLVYFSKQ